jgi:hypothetical protein
VSSNPYVQIILVPFFRSQAAGADRSVFNFRVLNKRIAIDSVALSDIYSAFHSFTRRNILLPLYWRRPTIKCRWLRLRSQWQLYTPCGIYINKTCNILATRQKLRCWLFHRVFKDIKLDFMHYYLTWKGLFATWGTLFYYQEFALIRSHKNSSRITNFSL